jgi:hypothetical protein
VLVVHHDHLESEKQADAPYLNGIRVAVLVWATLEESSRTGRLRTYPQVDNVIYMASGADWLKSFRTDGISGLVRSYWSHPPHSPYSTVSAFCGFAVFGVHDWAAHVMASILPALGLFTVWGIVRQARLRLWQCLALLLCAAAVPVWSNALEYLKPDCAAGLFAAIGIILLVGTGRRRLPLRRWASAGMPFALALLAKPTVFPQTFAFLCVGVIGRIVTEVSLGAKWLERRRIGELLVGVGTAIVIALPHYVMAGQREMQYINDIMFGAHRADWEFRGTLWEHLVFHVSGAGGAQFLGWPGWLLMGVGLSALVVVLWRRRLAEMAAVWGWLLAVVGTFVPPAVNHFKNAQFAVCFQCIAIVAGITGAAYLLRTWRRVCLGGLVRNGVAAAGLLALVAMCLGSLTWRFPRTAVEDQAITDARMRLVQAIYESVRGAAGNHGVVLIAGPLGHINQHLFSIWGVHDHSDVRATLLKKAVAADEFERRIALVDVILANNGGTGMISDRTARPGINEQLLGQVRSSSEWVSIRVFPTPGNNGYFELFRRKAGGRFNDGRRVVPSPDADEDERP